MDKQGKIEELTQYFPAASDEQGCSSNRVKYIVFSGCQGGR